MMLTLAIFSCINTKKICLAPWPTQTRDPKLQNVKKNYQYIGFWTLSHFWGCKLYLRCFQLFLVSYHSDWIGLYLVPFSTIYFWLAWDTFYPWGVTQTSFLCLTGKKPIKISFLQPKYLPSFTSKKYKQWHFPTTDLLCTINHTMAILFKNKKILV